MGMHVQVRRPGDEDPAADPNHFYAGPIQRAQRLRRHYLVDRADAAPVPRGRVVLRDRETGRRLELSLDESVAAAYEERVKRFRHAVEEACAGAGVRYVPAPTDVSVLDLLSTSARLAGLVGT